MQSVASPAFEDDEGDDDKPVSYDDSQKNGSINSRKRLMMSKSQHRLRLPGAFKRLTEPTSLNSPFTISSLPFSNRSRAEDKETDAQESRMLRQKSQEGSLRVDGVEQPLKRKDTYLLTDSPVLRAQRLREQAAASMQDNSVSYPPEPPYSAGSNFRFPTREKGDGRDVENLVLDNVPLSQSPIVLSPNRRENFESPLRPSASINTVHSTRTGRRRLPTPPSPQNVPAPAYYPPGGVPVDEPLADVKVASPEGILSPVYGAGSIFSPTLSHPLSPDPSSAAPPSASAPRPPYTRETSDVVISEGGNDSALGSTSATVGTSGHSRRPKRARTEQEKRKRVVKMSSGSLTAANITRLNDEVGTSTLNPLIRTFNSPIGEYNACIYP